MKSTVNKLFVALLIAMLVVSVSGCLGSVLKPIPNPDPDPDPEPDPRVLEDPIPDPAEALEIWEDDIINRWPPYAFMFDVSKGTADAGWVGSGYASFEERINGQKAPNWLQHQGTDGTTLWITWDAAEVEIPEGDYYIGIRVSTFRGDGAEKEFQYLQSYQVEVDGVNVLLKSSSGRQYFADEGQLGENWKWGRVIVFSDAKVHIKADSVIKTGSSKKWLGITHLILWDTDIPQGPIVLR